MEQPNYIAKALEYPDLLTVPEFIKVVDYKIDTFMIDRFWASMEHDKLIYVDDELIRWMGYEGDTKYAKRHFNDIVKNN